MQIEIFLYIYGTVCVSMIAFNLVYAVILRGSEPRLERRVRYMEQLNAFQLTRLAHDRPLDEGAMRNLGKKLRRVRNLIAFDRAMAALHPDQAALKAAYMARLQPMLLHLALVYLNRDRTQAAYYSFFLARYMTQTNAQVQALQDVLLQYMAKENLYCRVNALQALCAFGNCRHILEALELQDRGAVFIHEKIITESLLAFTGNPHQLISLLWERLPAFTPHTQLAIANYVRFCSGDYAVQMLALMQDERADKELRLSAVRYFGRYPYPPALDALLAMSAQTDPQLWEYATVSTSALASYSGDRVIKALKQALHSPNWYVRYAAAVSLEAQHVDYEDLIELVAGNDRYAREMMMYRLESRRLLKDRG